MWKYFLSPNVYKIYLAHFLKLSALSCPDNNLLRDPKYVKISIKRIKRLQSLRVI